MNKVITMLALTAGVLLMTGCAASKPVSEIPSWYLDLPDDPNMLFGVGSGESSRMQTARDKATQAARNNLAQSVEVKFDGLTKQFTEEVGVAGNSEVLEYFVEATKSVVSTVLIGAATDKAKILEKGNVYVAYILIKMDAAAPNKAWMDKLSQQDVMYTKFRASQTFQELEAETKKFEEYKESGGM